ncbi:uL14 family ribosomal protein [Bacillus mycoides]|uniref:uL14 family ribosomal protein n=1 Tax=Bacillus mycoides TaxID=1405 RepID=UPI003D07B5C0
MNKKNIIGLLAILAIIVTIVSINVVKSNADKQEAAALEAQKKRDEKYLNAATDFYISAEAFEYVSTNQLSTYSKVWSNAINNRTDFSLAVNTEIKNSATIITGITEMYTSMGENLKVVSEAANEEPKKYKETYEEYKEVYGIVTALNEQIKSPSGSLLKFNENANTLLQDYKKVKGNIDIAIPNKVKKEIEKRKKTKLVQLTNYNNKKEPSDDGSFSS